MRRIRRLEPVLGLEAALVGVFALLLGAFAVSAISGRFDARAAASAGVAVGIVALGLLYAWRLGAAGRRE